MDAKFYVPYETARELRLKGYPQSTDTWYVEMARGVRIFKNQTNKEYEYIARPTYHEVLDWLQSKGICVFASKISKMKKHGWFTDIQKGEDTIYPHGMLNTREDALNVAILETLKRI